MCTHTTAQPSPTLLLFVSCYKLQGAYFCAPEQKQLTLCFPLDFRHLLVACVLGFILLVKVARE